MSRSFRGRPDPQDNPEPDRDDAQPQPRGSAPQSRGNSSSSRPQPRTNAAQNRNIRPNVRGGQPSYQPPAPRGSFSPDELGEVEEDYNDGASDSPQNDMPKRLVASLIDVVVGYIINLIVTCIPFVNMFLHDQIVMVAYLLVKDFLFNGRGVGKNLMGLQVVDARTGAPASLLQSVKRNIVIYGPYILLYFTNQIIKFIPDENIKSIAQNVTVGIGTVYTIFALPYEAYRVYTRADGLRLGDEFAGTVTVPADMDFGNPAR